MTAPSTATLARNAPLSREDAQQILSDALAASTAETTTAILEVKHESLTRFANNEIHQNVTSRQRALTLRATIGRRAGFASTNRIDAEGLREVAQRALAIAQLSPEDPELPGLAPPTDYVPLPLFHDATATCTPEDRARAVGPVVKDAALRGLNAAGALSTTANAIAIANSAGLFAWHPDTHSQFTCTVRGEDSSGWCDRHRRDWRRLESDTFGEVAIRKAEDSRRPEAIDPGRYTVVLEPAAVAELVAFLSWLGLGAQSEQEGRSFLTGRLGQPITGSAITLVDDAHDPRSFGKPFDYEGTARHKVTVIENGIARAVVHDRRTAAKAGVESTGHACAPPATEGPLAYDLVLGAGTQTLDEIIAATDRGILVTRFWYNRVVDPRRTIVTGMTRDGTFLIEDGKVTRGLRNLRFNESVLEVLARADAFGSEAEPTVFDWSGSCVVAPALRVRDFQFTGVTRF